MKRLLRTWLCLALLAASAAGAWAQGTIAVEVDGRALVFDQPPVMQGGRVLVPLRGIFEALGAKVEWDAASRTIRATLGASSMVLPLGSSRAVVDGRTVALDVPAASVGGRTMVPLRFVAEALGADVRWDGAGRRVAIASGGTASVPGPLVTPAPGASPSPSPPAPAPSAFQAALDLPRLQVGNQAGLLKILDRKRQKVDYFRTLDDRTTAPITEEQRARIWATLGVPADQVARVARDVMASYPTLPKMPSLALLAVAGSGSAEASLAASLQDFVVAHLGAEKDNVLRRQAVLSLALMSSTSPAAVEAVLHLFETEDNLWVTFPVQMFFEYHASAIRAMPDLARLRSRAAAVQSLYTPAVLGSLGPGEGVGFRLSRGPAVVEDLSGQGLETLPTGLLDNAQLRQLSLAGNRLALLPATLGRLQALEALVVSGNLLTDLPDALSGLSRLRFLDLGGNALAEFPPAVLSLARLEVLDLSDNRLADLPPGMAALGSLRVLNLERNRLAHVPVGLTSLRNLDVLELEGNPLPVTEVEALRRALPGTRIGF